MNRTRILSVLLVAGLVPLAEAQTLVPLADQVESPLLPAGVGAGDVRMSAELAYFWKAEDGSAVAHFIGDFQLQIGQRSVESGEAVVWISPREVDGVGYSALEVTLWRNARVTEPSGTTTSGPVLFVTTNTTGDIRTSADKKTFSSSADMGTYKDSLRIRNAVRAGISDEDAPGTPLTVLDLGKPSVKEKLEVRPAVSYSAKGTLTLDEVDGRQIVSATGGVYVYAGEPDSGEFLELRADAAVIYLSKQAPAQPDDDIVEDRPDLTSEKSGSVTDQTGLASAGDSLGLSGAGMVDGVYLEGDIVLSRGEQRVRAEKLYYDFIENKAMIVDAVFRTVEPVRNVPVYVRAETVRQLSSREFQATKAKFTTSEFYTPHYHLGADKLTFIDTTSDSGNVGGVTGMRGGSFEVRHATLNLDGVPFLYWPYVRGDIKAGDTSIRSIRTGYSSDFGLELETKWRLFNLLGFEAPIGFDGAFLADYFSERGPATGVTLDYETDTYFGLYRGYYIHDTGVDNLTGRFRDEEPDTQTRGRTTLRHRQYLPNDWQLTLEGSYISDKNFLEEYYEREFEEGKDQETLIYLKKQVDNWAFTSLLQYRLMDFVTTTERFPDFSFRLIGEPVSNFAVFHSENRAGLVRYRPAERSWYREIMAGGREDASGTTARAETREEIEFPLTLGPMKVVPFGSIRGGVWDDSPDEGGLGRVFGTYGLRASGYAWKVLPDFSNEVLDLNQLRHIIKADITAWASHTNVDSHELFPFDENVEGIDEVDGVTIGLRQRLQTKRGAADKRRTVDWITFDLEMGLFNDAENDEFTNGYASYSRPENSISRNYVNASLVYRINDATALLSELNYDLNDGEVDVFNVTYAVERDPRLSYLIIYRFVEEEDSNLLGAGLNYKISEKYSFAVREEFDLERGKTAQFDVGFIRKFPRWYVGVTFSLDEADDDFGVSMSAWPEGLPQATIGSRRFTGLATSTGIRPGF